MNWISRLVAALIAVAAIAGILIHVEAQMRATGSILATAWILLGYFTILTNLLVAVVFGALALGVRVPPRAVGGTALAIALVGVIYGLLLQGLVELTAGSAVANVLMHRVTPLGGVLYWVVFTPKGTLRLREPLLWAIYPFAYLAYALLRGASEGHYAYPFIDLGQLGVGQVAINVVLISIGFLVCGWLMVGLDRWLGARKG